MKSNKEIGDIDYLDPKYSKAWQILKSQVDRSIRPSFIGAAVECIYITLQFQREDVCKACLCEDYRHSDNCPDNINSGLELNDL